MVGMRDVAKRAHVSLSTVSLAINGTGYVSPETHARITQAMQELHYVPNELARNLFRNRTDTIGVIVPTIRHPFFATLVAAIQRDLSSRGLRTLLCSTEDSEQGEADYVNMLRRRMMDAIIMCAHTEHDPEFWTSIGRPVVAFDRMLGDGIPMVGSDHEQGGNLIADKLIATGARHVIMVGGPKRQFPGGVSDITRADALANEGDVSGKSGVNGETSFPTVRYYMTLERRLAAAGIAYDYIEAGEVQNFQGYAHAIHAAIEEFGIGTGAYEHGTNADALPIDAIISSDIGAAYAIQEALRHDVSMPDELQVIAYDGTYVSELAGLPVTSVTQNFAGIAHAIGEAATALVQQADDADNPDASKKEHSSAAAGLDGATGTPLIIPVTLDERATTQ